MFAPAALVQSRKADLARQKVDTKRYVTIGDIATLETWIDRAIDLGTGAATLLGNLAAGEMYTGFAIAPAQVKPPQDLNGDYRSEILYRNSATGQVYRFSLDGFSIQYGDTTQYIEPDLAWTIDASPRGRLVLFIQGSNLTDRVMRVHTSYLKDVAPLMGRSVTLGLRGEL